MEGAHKLRQRVVGSRTRFLLTASVLVLLWLVFVWLAATGRLAELRYLNVPLLHPYPPAGYVQNPFNPSDKGDLVSSSEANRVKTDLQADGQLELRALEIDDPGLVSQADTGRAAANLSAVIVQNNAAGLFEREQVKLDSVVVGRVPDPNDSTIAWMVEERGTATISYYSKSNDSLVRRLSMKAIARFWLLKVGGRYLVADVQITSQAAPGASP
jgi:hypothetical protein